MSTPARIAHVRRVRAKSIRLQSSVTLAGLRYRAAGLGEPCQADDRAFMLEAAELIERALEFVPDAETERGRA